MQQSKDRKSLTVSKSHHVGLVECGDGGNGGPTTHEASLEEELEQWKICGGEITMFIGHWMKPRKRENKARGLYHTEVDEPA